MPQEIRYRTTLRRLLERVMTDGVNKIASVNIAKVSENSAVSRSTLYYWLSADSEDQEEWLQRYDPEVERRLRVFFSELLGEEVDIVERVVIDIHPRFQEMAIAAA